MQKKLKICSIFPWENTVQSSPEPPIVGIFLHFDSAKKWETFSSSSFLTLFRPPPPPMQADTDRERETAMQEVPAQASKASQAEPGGGGGGNWKWLAHHGGITMVSHILLLYFFSFEGGPSFLTACLSRRGGLPAVEWEFLFLILVSGGKVILLLPACKKKTLR